HPAEFDQRIVDVSGYYQCGFEWSNLWPDAASFEHHHNSDMCIYIDVATWDSRIHPKRSKDISGPWHVTKHRARVIGRFRTRLVPPGVPTTGGGIGPSITDVSYFRRTK